MRKLLPFILAGAIGGLALLAGQLMAPRSAEAQISVLGKQNVWFSQGPVAGTIVSTSAASADAGFVVFPDFYYNCQCNAAACVGPGGFADCNVTGTNAQPVRSANQLFTVYTPPGVTTISAMAVSGNATCPCWPGILR